MNNKTVLIILVILAELAFLPSFVRAVDLTPYFYAHWSLDESSGTNAYDSSGNNRNGTTVNNPVWVAGLLGNALQLNGVDQYVNFTDSSVGNFERNESFSIEFWFKMNTTDSPFVYQNEIINKRTEDSEGRGYEIILSPGDTVWVMIGNATDMILDYSDTVNFTDMNWHQVIVTYDGSSSASGVYIYIDSVKSQNILFDGLSENISNVGNLNFGEEYESDYFNGLIDEVVFYNKTLNQSEVNFRWNDGAGTESMSSGMPPTTTTTTITTTTTVTSCCCNLTNVTGDLNTIMAMITSVNNTVKNESSIIQNNQTSIYNLIVSQFSLVTGNLTSILNLGNLDIALKYLILGNISSINTTLPSSIWNYPLRSANTTNVTITSTATTVTETTFPITETTITFTSTPITVQNVTITQTSTGITIQNVTTQNVTVTAIAPNVLDQISDNFIAYLFALRCRLWGYQCP
jgi:hypothetical protein